MDKAVYNSPFTYRQPEEIPSDEAVELFVDFFDSYYYLGNRSNTFINGPRGSGKSMLFRMLLPDCQMLKEKKKLTELPFLAVLVPIKDGDPKITDIEVLNSKNKQAVYYINEHILVIHVFLRIISALKSLDISPTVENTAAFKKYYDQKFLRYLKLTGWKPTSQIDPETIDDILFEMDMLLFEMKSKLLGEDGFLKASAFELDKPVVYEGPLCLYNNFLLPNLKAIKELPFLPNKPFYLLMDDADWLNDYQKHILNSWISYRNSNEVCFKVSTQFRYNTFSTSTGGRIDFPHDYFDIDLTENYTSDSSGTYLTNLQKIVEKRLVLFYEKDINANDFFPNDDAQEKKIAALFDKYKTERGYDYAYRYARPDYMKDGYKNKYTYSYAGFTHLTNISSGVIRNFLDPANLMWIHKRDEVQREDFLSIDPQIQDRIIRRYSKLFYIGEYEKEKSDSNNTADKKAVIKQMFNLIWALGKVFRSILLSELTERRVFAFFFETEPSDRLSEVINMAVHKGYLLKAVKGSKSGFGNVRMYVLNRILAPNFDLDPNNFSGYKYISAEWLEEAISDPSVFVKKYVNGQYSRGLNPNQQLLPFDEFKDSQDDFEYDIK